MSFLKATLFFIGLFLFPFLVFAQWERELLFDTYYEQYPISESTIEYIIPEYFTFYNTKLWCNMTLRESVILTQDGGESFEAMNENYPPQNGFGIPRYFLDSSTILLSYSTLNIYTREVNHIQPVEGLMQPIFFENKKVIVARRKNDFSSFFRSYDSGQSWEEVTLPSCTASFKQLYPCGENHLCLACIDTANNTLQMHVSRDEGTIWESLPTIRRNNHLQADNVLHISDNNEIVEDFYFPPRFYDANGQMQESAIDESLRLLTDSAAIGRYDALTTFRSRFYVRNNLLYTFYNAYDSRDSTAYDNTGDPYGDDGPPPLGFFLTVTDLATKTTKLSLFQHYEDTIANMLHSEIISFADSEELGVIMHDKDIWLYKTQDRGQTPAIFGEPTPRDGDNSGGGDIPTALENAPLENTLKLWPNPSSGTLRLSGVGASGELHIYDALGRKHLSFPAQPTAKEVREIKFNGLPSGLYFLETESEKGRVRKSFVVE